MSGGPVPRSMGNRSVGAVGGGPAAMTTNGHAIVSELSRRVVASILLATGTTSLGAPEILSVLADLLTLSLLRMLRTASLRAQHAHRHLLNIFDVLPALGNFHLDARRLLEWARSPGRLGRALKAGSGSMSGGGSGRGPMLVPLGRSLLRALGDEEEEDEEDEGENMNMKGSGATLGTGGSSSLSAVMDTGGVRPTYLLDIYPPFPRSYTFRRTETKGIRESDKVLIAKAKAEQQRQMESNLFRLLGKTNALPTSVNWDEGDPRDDQIIQLSFPKRHLSDIAEANRS